MASGFVAPILTVIVPVFPLAESETVPTASTQMWSPVSSEVHDPPAYVPLTALNVVKDGFEYVRYVTVCVMAFVRPRESAAVTVTDLFPAPLNTEEVISAPVPEKAPEIVYEDIDAPLPAVAEDCTLIFVYPLTYIPLEFIQAFVLTGESVTVGAVGFIADPT